LRISKLGALCAATAMTAAGLALPLAQSAPAATPSVACSKLSALPLAQTGGKLKSTYSQCTPSALSAGGTSLTKVSTTGPTSGKLTNTITWKNGKGTTVATVKYAPASTKGKCKAPYDTRVKITGSVKSSTGAAKAIVKAGEPLSAMVCAVSKAGPKQGQSALEPGTKFKL
jgi:hypothetical protein